MISCTEFVPVYNMLFRHLYELGGEAAVYEYWDSIIKKSPGLEKLRSAVTKEGIRGCYTYWSRVLSEEAADFSLTLDEEKGIFVLDMHACPSKSRVLKCKHVKAYPNYCKHCDVLYRKVLEDFGYRYEYDLSRCDRAECRLTVTDRGKCK